MHNGTGRNARIKELQRRVTEKAVERAALTKEWVIDKLRENFRFGCPGSPRTAKVPPLPVPMKPLVLHYRGRFSPATNSPNF
jgi:hypothetical protein